MGAGAIALTVLSLVPEAATYRAVLGAMMVPIDSNMVPPTGGHPVNKTEDLNEAFSQVRQSSFEDEVFEFSWELPECEDLRWRSLRTASDAPNPPSESAMASQDLAFLPADLPLEQCATLAVACLAAMLLFTWTCGALGAVSTCASLLRVALTSFLPRLLVAGLLRRFKSKEKKQRCGGVDAALMMSDAGADADWDAKKYPHAKPFKGKKGPDFERFENDFGTAMGSILLDRDDDNDLQETMQIRTIFTHKGIKFRRLQRPSEL